MKLVETEYTDRNGTKRTRRERLFRFPDFWDYDWFYYNAIEQAEDEGKHMVVLKARARGYSFKGASMLCRNYFLIPKSIAPPMPVIIPMPCMSMNMTIAKFSAARPVAPRALAIK